MKGELLFDILENCKTEMGTGKDVPYLEKSTVYWQQGSRL